MKKIMAILNLTPDSFFPGSRLIGPDGRFDTSEFVARVETALAQGADIIDLGACSTRPGSQPVSAEEEWARLQPALELWRSHFRAVPLSVDTFRADVALRCAEYTDQLIVNDVAAGDERMLSAVVSMGCGYVAMHHDTLSEQVSAVEQVNGWYDAFEKKAEAAGLRDWWFDPGFGFGKTLSQNWTILRHLEKLPHHRPILVGLSRKSMFHKLLRPAPEKPATASKQHSDPASRPETLLLTRLANRLALSGGASIFRVHDPAEAF
ncbi:MAG: dihydropteroate synthase [Bacteroidales bacterium]|nr:dihydropteroate synthase [Bacteroidales bacterium]